MSSFSPPSPLAISFRFRRKSSSASTSASFDNHIYSLGGAASSSSPPLSSPPPLTPLCLSGHYKYTDWQGDDHLDGPDWIPCNQPDKIDIPYSWSRRARPEHSISYTHRPFPSLMTRFTSHTHWGHAPFPCSPSPFSPASRTTHFYPQGDSAVADDCEEYDLESMNIHIRETYFATSAERGRWLSSPIAPRARSHAVPPIRGHSSPVMTLADVSPLGERFRRRIKSCGIVDPISNSSSEDHDEDMRYPSSLPPSSPLTSPLSDLSFLSDDCEGEAIADPCSNPDDCHSSPRTPETNTSLNPRPSISHCTPTTDSATTSSPCYMSPRHNDSPNTVHVHAPSAVGSDADGMLSPLSQFELDLPEVEPLKLPLSDMENKPYPGQRAASPGVTADTSLSPDGPLHVQFLSMNPNHGLDISPNAVSERYPETGTNKRGNCVNSLGARKAKKRAAIRSGNSTSDTKKRKGGENHTFNHSEPPSKRLKPSRCRDDSATHGLNSHPRRSGTNRSKQHFRPRSRPATAHCDVASICARETPRSTAQKQQPIPDAVDTVNAEFHASLTGMLIEALATSRATSMDSAALYHVLTQAHPHLVAERSKQELLMDIATALEAGQVRCGMFEKVDSSGERSRHKALESRWFYVPERDEDEERASLISAIMPRQKRNETKKYKQYYYRPLDKISRWDPEDAP